MMHGLTLLLLGLAWIGHAYLWTGILNNLYARPLPKTFLKGWRYFTAVLILAFPLVMGSVIAAIPPESLAEAFAGGWARIVGLYGLVCCGFSAVFVVVTIQRGLRRPPECVQSEQTRTLDWWPEYGHALIGNGKGRFLTRLPGNGVFRLDITEYTVALPDLPRSWNGLTYLILSDLHFHGTPSRLYFDRMMEELLRGPTPDIVCLVGDYLDTDVHHEWIEPLLGRLPARDAKWAILGNHDVHHDPARVRAALTRAGYTVLSNRWERVSIRGVPCVVVGHEGPWLTPPPELSEAPGDAFRVCLSHTPDHFYWAQAQKIQLMFCGHVHGGGIRVPLIGSIFVPSKYGRRFDGGVFHENPTVMIVSRGISGKEPIRIRCNPQVLRVTLQPLNSSSHRG
ncbi:MAG: metallophosphoesterase [Gemmata sp.]|nr:metallophosphoesterase [Gemmata sp.]